MLTVALHPSAPVIVNSIVSTLDIDWSAFVKLSPNPSNGDVMVSWNDLKFVQVKCIDSVNGRTLASRQINTAMELGFDRLELSGGVYMVVFKFNKQPLPLKLIVLN